MFQPKNRLKVFICPLLFCYGCNSGVKWHSYQSVPITGWERTDTLSYTLPEFPDSGKYNLTLCLRVKCSTQWTRLPIGVEYNLSNPDTLFRDTLMIQLKDTSSLMGNANLLQYMLPIRTLDSRRLHPATLRVFHLMQPASVPFVMDIGLRIE